MNDIWCIIIIPAIALAVVFVAIHYRKQQATKEAYATYQEALYALRASPTSADTRQKALNTGRQYANLARNQKGQRGETVFDEVMLMNDIGAATAGAGAGHVAAAVPTAPASTASVEDRIKRLEELRNKGVISDQEFDARRQKILDEL